MRRLCMWIERVCPRPRRATLSTVSIAGGSTRSRRPRTGRLGAVVGWIVPGSSLSSRPVFAFEEVHRPFERFAGPVLGTEFPAAPP